MDMPLVAIREGNKTVYRVIQKDMSKYDERPEKDLTTSGKKSISNYDVDEKVWNRIFNKNGKM